MRNLHQSRQGEDIETNAAFYCAILVGFFLFESCKRDQTR